MQQPEEEEEDTNREIDEHIELEGNLVLEGNPADTELDNSSLFEDLLREHGDPDAGLLALHQEEYPTTSPDFHTADGSPGNSCQDQACIASKDVEESPAQAGTSSQQDPAQLMFSGPEAAALIRQRYGDYEPEYPKRDKKDKPSRQPWQIRNLSDRYLLEHGLKDNMLR